MSTTYDLVCTVCKDTLWIGQGNTIYDAPLRLRPGADDYDPGQLLAQSLKAFLYEHIEHPLVFVSEHHVELYDDDMPIERVLQHWRDEHVAPVSYQDPIEAQHVKQ